MPIYEYACGNCDHTLDELQKMSDDPLQDCPECGKPQLKRLLSAPRFRLKGKGWYETDFKQDNQRNLSTGDADAAKNDKKDGKKDKPADSSGKADSKSDGGTAAKSPSKSDD